MNVLVKGQYKKSIISENVEFKIRLPDFCEYRIVTVKVYVDEEAIGDHDIIFGDRCCTEVGLVIAYKTIKLRGMNFQFL